MDKNKTFTFYKLDGTEIDQLPLFEAGVSAGFPSPADDYMDVAIDLNRELIRNKTATFCVRVSGTSMRDAGIQDDSILIVDRSLQPENNNIVLAVINGEFTVKRINTHDDDLYLMPENGDFQPIKITVEMDFRVWGVVTSVINQFL